MVPAMLQSPEPLSPSASNPLKEEPQRNTASGSVI